MKITLKDYGSKGAESREEKCDALTVKVNGTELRMIVKKEMGEEFLYISGDDRIVIQPMASNTIRILRGDK